MTILLIDGDLIAYRCAAAAEKAVYNIKTQDSVVTYNSKAEVKDWLKAFPEEEVEIEHSREYGPVEHALYLAKENVHGIVEALDGIPEIWLSASDGGNFRKQLATVLPYKGNRSPLAKPKWLQETRDYLIAYQGAKCAEEEEADDRLGIRATEEREKGNEEVVICSIDKDLDQIEGHHYNWVRKEAYHVNEKDAIRSFYTQLLVGDRTDNIPGIAGVGPKGAERILEGYSKESGLFRAAREAWHKAYPSGFSLPSKEELRPVDEVLLEVGRLLWIRRYPGQLWEFPK